jgi:hypothetical protein
MLCGRKEEGEDEHEGHREDQELNNRRGCYNLDLETTPQTFMLPHAQTGRLRAWFALSLLYVSTTESSG